jgi:hypothetical protein
MDEACAVDVCVDLNALAKSPAHSFTAAIISVMIEQGPSSWYHCFGSSGWDQGGEWGARAQAEAGLYLILVCNMCVCACLKVESAASSDERCAALTMWQSLGVAAPMPTHPD